MEFQRKKVSKICDLNQLEKKEKNSKENSEKIHVFSLKLFFVSLSETLRDPFFLAFFYDLSYLKFLEFQKYTYFRKLVSR